MRVSTRDATFVAASPSALGAAAITVAAPVGAQRQFLIRGTGAAESCADVLTIEAGPPEG